MKLLKKLSLFVALIVTTVALAPAMPDAHAAGSITIINNDVVDYININISYSSDLTLEGSFDIIDPSDPLLVGDAVTLPFTESLDESFDIILTDSYGNILHFYDFDKEFADIATTFVINYSEEYVATLTFTSPGYENVVYVPDYVE